MHNTLLFRRTIHCLYVLYGGLKRKEDECATDRNPEHKMVIADHDVKEVGGNANAAYYQYLQLFVAKIRIMRLIVLSGAWEGKIVHIGEGICTAASASEIRSIHLVYILRSIHT